MQTIQFKEANPTKCITFAILYVACLTSVTFWYLNSSSLYGGSNTLIFGLLVVLISIFPIIRIIKMFYKKVTVDFKSDTLHILQKGAEPIVIDYDDVHTVEINAECVNTLTLYDRSGAVLYTAKPVKTMQPIDQIATQLANKGNFNISSSEKKSLKVSHKMVVYNRLG